MGILVTDALELAEDKPFWQQIATAGFYGRMLCVMMMMMIMATFLAAFSGLVLSCLLFPVLSVSLCFSICH